MRYDNVKLLKIRSQGKSIPYVGMYILVLINHYLLDMILINIFRPYQGFFQASWKVKEDQSISQSEVCTLAAQRNRWIFLHFNELFFFRTILQLWSAHCWVEKIKTIYMLTTCFHENRIINFQKFFCSFFHFKELLFFRTILHCCVEKHSKQIGFTSHSTDYRTQILNFHQEMNQTEGVLFIVLFR